MSTTPESKVKKNIRKLLDASRTYWFMPVQSGYGVRGVPDFLVCHQGQFIGIEAKSGDGKTTALQEMNLQKIRDAGGKTLVVNEENLQALQELLDGHDEGRT